MIATLVVKLLFIQINVGSLFPLLLADELSFESFVFSINTQLAAPFQLTCLDVAYLNLTIHKKWFSSNSKKALQLSLAEHCFTKSSRYSPANIDPAFLEFTAMGHLLAKAGREI